MVTKGGVFPQGIISPFLYSLKFIKKMEEVTMQKKNAGITRNFVLKGLLFLAALTLCIGFFACKVAVGGGETEVPRGYTDL